MRSSAMRVTLASRVSRGVAAAMKLNLRSAKDRRQVWPRTARTGNDDADEGRALHRGRDQSSKVSRREDREREPEESARVTPVLGALEAGSVVAAVLPSQMAQGRSGAFLGDWRGAPLRGLASSRNPAFLDCRRR